MAHLLAHEKKHMGGFRRIYPVESSADNHYSKFFEQSSSSLCSETAASKARSELARLQVCVFNSVCGIVVAVACRGRRLSRRQRRNTELKPG